MRTYIVILVIFFSSIACAIPVQEELLRRVYKNFVKDYELALCMQAALSPQQWSKKKQQLYKRARYFVEASGAVVGPHARAMQSMARSIQDRIDTLLVQEDVLCCTKEKRK